MKQLGIKGLLAGMALACSFALPAAAAEISGVKFPDTATVAGKELKLNGYGLRTKFVIKVYAAGLYLNEKKATTADIMKVEGPRRVTLVMMRDISSDDFGQAFMTGLNANLDKAEKSKIVSQIAKFGEMFATIDRLKKGDVLYLDWIPGAGTQAELNGRKIGEQVPDVAFYNAILRIWIGDKPADSSLKPALLGAPY
ncbi:MAG: chalcone isomerase family protein [Telluria sp.]